MPSALCSQVELVYPPSLLDPEPLFSSLQKLLAHREPHHRSGMWKCILYVSGDECFGKSNLLNLFCRSKQDIAAHSTSGASAYRSQPPSVLLDVASVEPLARCVNCRSAIRHALSD